jgi:peptidoglycan/xylan/chitin deacetylase (PgdA/CDA1 family)
MKKGLIFIFSSILLVGLIFSIKSLTLSSNKVLGVNNQNLIIRNAEPDETNKLVALTFDDGPAPITRDILEVLNENNVLATFFVTGQNITTHTDILIETYQRGHEIGNHTNTHPITILMNRQDIAKEILITEEKIYQAIGRKPKIIRAPYALYPENLLSNVELFNMTLISWDVDPEDWKQVNKEVITQRVVSEVTPGSIILLHDGPPELDRSNTLESLTTIINTLQDDGYKFVTVSELLEFDME